MRSPTRSWVFFEVAGVLLLGVVGCGTRELDWEIAFEPADLTATTARIDARISRGACPGTGELWSETVFPGSPFADTPPDLEAGTYCFEARVGNAACEWVARGAETVELPRDTPLVVTARPEPATSNCATTCVEGLCDGGGGGGSCPFGGCSFTCTDNCSASCEGGGCTMTCTGAATCDFSCAGGSCTVTCGEASDCDASCAAGSCEMTCSEAASCDFSCASGRCGFTCADNCTTSCPLGNCTGP